MLRQEDEPQTVRLSTASGHRQRINIKALGYKRRIEKTMNSIPSSPTYVLSALPLDEHFHACAAQALLAFASTVRAKDHAEHDLSSLRVIVPGLHIASELRKALANTHSESPLLLPAFSTLEVFAQEGIDTASLPEPLAGSERRLLLYEALRHQKWFDENALWTITAEMDALFDELTLQSVVLPDTQAALTAQLEAAYAIRASSHLAFEARVIHEMWKTMTSFSQPDATGAYHLKLAALAQKAVTPLFFVLECAPDAVLSLAEQQFLNRYAERAPVFVVYPETRHEAKSVLMQTLSYAWPEASEASNLSLFERAQKLPKKSGESPLASRLQLIACDGPEKEAQAVVAQVGQWLLDGLSNIALIAPDRLIARRVRALLEREHILVVDETGWKLSTSRAAATVDALIEVVAGRGYYRDLLDLCKSPFVFADIPTAKRQESVLALEHAIRGASVKMGIAKIRQALVMETTIDQALKDRASNMIDRIDRASALLQGKPVPLVRWLERLENALEILGAQDSLQADAAGKNLLDLLAARSHELRSNTGLFALDAWREWLNGELEAAYFRDETIHSPIVLTSLKAATLRHFEAALIMGGDAEHMSVVSGNTFFNQATRRELGLSSPQQAQEEQRHRLSLLIALVPKITITWQFERNSEANLLAPELSLLCTLHQLIWQDDLRLKKPLPVRKEFIIETDTQPALLKQAQPIVPPEDLPQKISVSAYATLVACPYRFFARHVLRLGEMDEVSESMAKNDYGALVHRALESFHRAYPMVSALPEQEALDALKACVNEVFAQAIAENFRSTGWYLRLEKRLPAYIAWQCEQEREGWRYIVSESTLSIHFALENNQTLELHGRIDRLDSRESAQDTTAYRLLDYKTQTAKIIKDRLGDDIQLPVYALLHGNAAEAAYVALDDETVKAFSSSNTTEELHLLAQQQKERLIKVFNLMYAGNPLPAHGADNICSWCEMQGLCRRAHVDQ